MLKKGQPTNVAADGILRVDKVLKLKWKVDYSFKYCEGRYPVYRAFRNDPTRQLAANPYTKFYKNMLIQANMFKYMDTNN